MERVKVFHVRKRIGRPLKEAPKSGAQRSKEYRERKKTLKTAASLMPLSITGIPTSDSIQYTSTGTMSLHKASGSVTSQYEGLDIKSETANEYEDNGAMISLQNTVDKQFKSDCSLMQTDNDRVIRNHDTFENVDSEMILPTQDVEVINSFRAFQNHENFENSDSEMILPTQVTEVANSFQSYKIPVTDGEKCFSHISEEVIIKNEDHEMNSQEEQYDHSNYPVVEVKVEINEQTNDESNSAVNMNKSGRNLPEYDYYRLPESYYSISQKSISQQCPNYSDNPYILPVQQDVYSAQVDSKAASIVKKIEPMVKIPNNLLKVQKKTKLNTFRTKPKKTYTCMECFASFTKMSSYRQHKRQHYKMGTHKILKDRRQGDHIVMIRGIPHFKCDKCNKSYSFETSLNMHIKMCHGPVPFKMIIKEEPQESQDNNYNYNLIGHQIDINPTNEYAGSPYDDRTLLAESSELEDLWNSILSLQQDSINAAEAIINGEKKTHHCPECLKFFDSSGWYRTHIKSHLRPKYVLFKKHKIEFLNRLKKFNSFTNFYDSKSNTVIQRSRNHVTAVTETELKTNITTESDTKLCLNVDEGELQKPHLNNLNSLDHNTAEDIATATLDDNMKKDNMCVLESRNSNDLILQSNLDNLENVEKHDKTNKAYDCSKCTKSYLNPSVFREHLKEHLKEEIQCLNQNKKEMYTEFINRCKYVKCDRCNKKYLSRSFFQKHLKFCQGPIYDIREDIQKMFGKSFNQSDVEVYPENQYCVSSEATLPQNSAVMVQSERESHNDDVNEQNFGTSLDIKQIEKRSSIERVVAIINKCEFICPKCPRVFLTMGIYWQHLNKHYVREIKEAQMKNQIIKRQNQVKCDETTAVKKKIDLNMITEHGDATKIDDQEYKCTCGKVYSRRSRMETCFKSHTWEVVKKLPRCLSCKYSFKSKDDLALHKNLVHTEHRYLCRFCPMEYHRSCDLISHLEIHKRVQLMEQKVLVENLEEKVYLTCFICNEIAKDLNEFKLHFLNDHSKPYFCSICVKNFTSLSEFMSHIKIYHLSSQKRWLVELLEAFFALVQSWECRTCNFKTENPDLIADHLYSHRTLYAVGLDSMPRSANPKITPRCADCRRVYNSNGSLEVHRGFSHNMSDDLKRKFLLSVDEYKRESKTNSGTCAVCSAHFPFEKITSAHFSSYGHIELQSFLLNEQFISANMSGIESGSSVEIVIDSE